jgi:hypothetical protein
LVRASVLISKPGAVSALAAEAADLLLVAHVDGAVEDCSTVGCQVSLPK